MINSLTAEISSCAWRKYSLVHEKVLSDAMLTNESEFHPRMYLIT